MRSLLRSETVKSGAAPAAGAHRYQRADIDRAAGDHAIKGRDQAAKAFLGGQAVEIGAGRFHRRVLGGEIGVLGVLVLAGNRALREQRIPALGRGGCQLLRRLGVDQIGAALLHLARQVGRVEFGQKLALFHRACRYRHTHFQHIAADLGIERRGGEGLDVAGQVESAALGVAVELDQLDGGEWPAPPSSPPSGGRRSAASRCRPPR